MKNNNSGAQIGYIDDAEGQRVAKGTIGTFSCDTSSNGFTETAGYVLGPNGEQVTEVDGQGIWEHTNVFAAGQLIATYQNDGQGIHFQLSDWLGTRHVQTDYAGNLESTYQNMPFGELIPPGQSLGTTEHFYTGKERDSESGLDYFGARYYASGFGRWMSPDWAAKAEPVPYAKLDNPQSLNLYAYVNNNPLSNRDEDGHESDKDKDKKLPAPDAQHNHTIVVRQVEGQKGNPAGHVTVEVDGGKEVGFGPKQDMTKKQLIENKSVPGQVEPRAPGVKTLDSVTINVTADQAKAANATIADRTANPGNYQLVGSSCVTFGEQVIQSAGAPRPDATLPSALISDIRNQQYHDKKTQTPTQP